MIVDASAFVATVHGETLDRILASAETLGAPDLIVPEVFNVFWKLQRSGMNVPDPKAIVATLSKVTILPSLPYALRASELANDLDHAVYDCLYLAVAEARNDVVLTADVRFAEKVRRSNLAERIRLVDPHK